MRTAFVIAAIGSFVGLAVIDAVAGDYRTAAVGVLLAVVNGLVFA